MHRKRRSGLRPVVLLLAILAVLVVPSVAETTPATAAPLAVRINAGGGGYTDSQGRRWESDRYFTGGQTYSTTARIGGTANPTLYQTERYGSMSYHVPVPASGTYTVRVHLAEIYFSAVGRRAFDVKAEGGYVARGVDVWAKVGKNKGYVLEAPVAVRDGTLDVDFVSVVENPKLSGLEVLGASGSTPPPPPPSSNFGPGQGRPFAPTSAWNTPIPANPVLDPASAAMVKNLSSGAHPGIANLYDYGWTVYHADASTPRYRVDCTMNWGTCELEQEPVPIPDGAKPTPGSDGHMVVVDSSTRKSYEFWQYSFNGGRPYTSWGGVSNVDGDGRDGESVGAGVSGLAGMVLAHEISQGRIDHALGFSTKFCQGPDGGTNFRYPATKTDGKFFGAGAVPEGARVQLDPSVDVDAIPGITQGEKIVAKALQKYGAYALDCGAANMGFGFENPLGKPNPYPAAGFAWDYYGMDHLPWHRMRVLRNWNGA